MRLLVIEDDKDLNRQLVAKQREFEDKQRDGKRDFDQRQQALLRELGGKLQNVEFDKFPDVKDPGKE